MNIHSVSRRLIDSIGRNKVICGGQTLSQKPLNEMEVLNG